MTQLILYDTLMNSHKLHSYGSTQQTPTHTQTNTSGCWYAMNEALDQYYKQCNHNIDDKFLNFIQTNEFDNCSITDIIGNDMKWDMLHFDDNFPIPNDMKFDHIKQKIDFVSHILNYCYNTKQTPKTQQIRIISNQIIASDTEYTQLKQKESNLEKEINTLITKEHENNNRQQEIESINQEIINQQFQIQQKIKQLKVKQIQLQAKKKQLQKEQTQIYIQNMQLQKQKEELIVNKQKCQKIKQDKIKQYEINVKFRQQNVLNKRNQIRLNMSKLQRHSYVNKISFGNAYVDYLDNGMEELSFFALNDTNENENENHNSIYKLLNLDNINIENQTNTLILNNKSSEKLKLKLKSVRNSQQLQKPQISEKNISNDYDKQWDVEANMLFDQAGKEWFELLRQEEFRMQLKDTQNTLRLYNSYAKIDEQHCKTQLNATAYYHYQTIHCMEKQTVEKVLNKQKECLSDMDKIWQLYLDINNKQTNIADKLCSLYNCRQKIENHIDGCDKKQSEDIKLFRQYGAINIFEGNIKSECKQKKKHFRAYGKIMDVLIVDYETLDTSQTAYIAIHLLITECMDSLTANSLHIFGRIRKSQSDYGRLCEKRHYKKLGKLTAKKHGKQLKQKQKRKQKPKKKKKNNKKRKRKRIYNRIV